jgi:hypothetical protein
MTSSGRGKIVADMLISFVCPATSHFAEAVRRSECAENMQRLTLAVLLYQHEHGKLPDENWVEQVMPYLGENGEQYFSCASNPLPEGETTYAIVRCADTVGGSLGAILLIELSTPVAFDKAVVSADNLRGLARRDGILVAYRSGAVQYLSGYDDKQELLRSLESKTESD